MPAKTQAEKNEQGLSCVWGGLNAHERQTLKAHPCIFCGNPKASPRWAPGCPHHQHLKQTRQCIHCWLFNSCRACNAIIYDYRKLKPGHVPESHVSEKVEQILWMTHEVENYPEHILEYYDLI